MQELTIDRLTGYYRRRAPLIFGGHRHGEREFKYVFAGKLEVTYDNTVITLSAQDAMLTEPNVFHRERTLTADCEYLVLQFSSACFPSVEGAVIRPLGDWERRLCLLLCEGLSAELRANEWRSDRLASVSAPPLRLFEALLLSLTSAPQRSAPQESARGALYHSAVDLMRADLSRHLTIGELSRALGTSPTLLKSVFAEYTGRGVQAHYLGLRLEAARLLLSEGHAVAEVAERLGFSSPSYFSQCFLRECGCPPSRYRK